MNTNLHKDPRDRSHRRPPQPLFWNNPPGTCRFCGEPTLNAEGVVSKRLRWHRACASAHRFTTDRFFARQVVKLRDGGVCASCDLVCDDTGWDVDHIKPLKDAHGDLAYFLQSNTQSLCGPCHRRKSATEQRKLNPGAISVD